MFKKNAYDLYTEETAQIPIITLWPSLDRFLGGGIQTGLITELCGPPAGGKTTMCKQLAVTVQFAQEIDGVGGKAIYIDTNQSFFPWRLQEIVHHICNRYKEAFRNSPDILLQCPLDPNEVLANISYMYCRNYFQLLAAVELIKEKVASESQIKLIVIDSFSSLLRRFKPYLTRTGIVYSILTDLQMIADKYNLAVVITNELTTRFSSLKRSYICPALGDSLGHKVGQRLLLGIHLEGNYRLAFFQKCFRRREAIIFKITEAGLRR